MSEIPRQAGLVVSVSDSHAMSHMVSSPGHTKNHHITMVPASSSGTMTNVLPHRNVMPETQDMTPDPVTVYRRRT